MAIFIMRSPRRLIRPGGSITIRRQKFPFSPRERENAMSVNPPLNRKLRMGLVGGGGGFIGPVHALAAMLDNRAILTAAALSSNPAKARALAPDFDIPPERAYGSYQEMAAVEARLTPSERIDFVSIATPNSTHF